VAAKEPQVPDRVLNRQSEKEVRNDRRQPLLRAVLVYHVEVLTVVAVRQPYRRVDA
jgi:hypothetical protein